MSDHGCCAGGIAAAEIEVLRIVFCKRDYRLFTQPCSSYTLLVMIRNEQIEPPVTKMTLPARSGISLSGLKVIPLMIMSRYGGLNEYLYLDEVLFELMARTQTTIIENLLSATGGLKHRRRGEEINRLRKLPRRGVLFGPAFRTPPHLDFAALTP